MISLQCKNCNYKFEKDSIPNRCPYCSKDGTIERAKNAQDILDDVIGTMD